MEAQATPGLAPLELAFGVRGAAPVRYAAAPTLGFELEISTPSPHAIQSINLQVQVQIAARRRSYAEEEQPQLEELFGTPQRWSDTLRTLVWLRTTQVVPGFTGATVIELQVPCTYDFEVSAAKYLAALRDGEVPLELLFGGTVFYRGAGGLLQTAMIGWDREADYRMPVSVWREAMDMYFPGSAWLRLQRETFDRLHAYRAQNALTSWEQAVERLLDQTPGLMDALRKIADAVLYEGYVLWPYSRTATKNQRRWTFGGVYPRAHSEEHPDDRSIVQTECLVEAARAPRIDVRLRFLHVVERLVRSGDALVDQVTVDGERYVAWDEATERESRQSAVGSRQIEVPAGESLEEVARDVTLIRRWRELRGEMEVSSEEVRPGLHRVTVVVSNTTPFSGEREEALRQTFCSAHLVLTVEGGEFVSLTDPPTDLRNEAAACENEGLWPVLVGEEGERHTMLASPIILADYPQIAPESPGDLFDGGEIDQLLILNILSLTDEERAQMRAADPRTREILERTESLSEEELMRLHGAIREFGLARAR